MVAIQQDQRGALSPLMIVLLLILIAVIGFAGWRVWDARHQSEKSSETSGELTPTEEAEEALSLETASPLSEAYVVEIPTDWLTGTCEDNPDILFLAPSEEYLGKCATEFFGTVSIQKVGGDVRQSEADYTAEASFEGVTYAPVIIDGMEGYRVSYVLASETMMGFPPVGTHEAAYYLFDGTNTYIVSYSQQPEWPDYQTEFTSIAESLSR